MAMAMTLFIDLLITENDLTLDSGGEPILTGDRASIAQDIKHLIRETGLMVSIIGNRNALDVADALRRLVLEIEVDERLIPGAVSITRADNELFYVVADTVDFGPITFNVGL